MQANARVMPRRWRIFREDRKSFGSNCFRWLRSWC